MYNMFIYSKRFSKQPVFYLTQILFGPTQAMTTKAVLPKKGLGGDKVLQLEQ